MCGQDFFVAKQHIAALLHQYYYHLIMTTQLHGKAEHSCQLQYGTLEMPGC